MKREYGNVCPRCKLCYGCLGIHSTLIETFHSTGILGAFGFYQDENRRVIEVQAGERAV